VNEKGCKTFEEFSATVLSVIKNVPQGILQSYFDSMCKRMAKTIEFDGDKTRY
jgi:hypothetical protein